MKGLPTAPAGIAAFRKERIMTRLLQCKTATNSIRNRRTSTLLHRQALGVLIIAIAGIVSFASPAQPVPALVPNRALIGPANAGQGSATQALFDLDSPTTGPFPSDWFTVPDYTQNTLRRISLPLPNCQVQVSDCEDTTVLNELDGFNVQPRLSVPFSGPIDVNTVTSDTLFLVSLGSTGSGQDDMPRGLTGRGSGQYRQPQGGDYMPWGTVIGINQVVWDTFTNTLHVESDELLAQHTRFALIVTRGIHDGNGAPVEASEAFRRFRTDMRTEYKQALLQAIQAARQIGVREEDIAAASVFTTQSASAVLEKIRDQIHEAVPDPADFLLGPSGERTVFSLAAVTRITWQQEKSVGSLSPGVDVDLSLLRTIYPGAVGSVAFGKYLSPDYEVHPLQYIPTVGTRSGTPAVQVTNDIYFNLFLPSAPKPTNGWPVAIVVHGVGSSKNETPLNVVSSMAKYGIATITINDVGHGFGPLSTLTVSRTDGAPITFLEGGRGIDQDGKNGIGSAEGIAAARPRAIVAFSDGYRQTAADLMQLAREIEVGMDVDGNGQRDLDPSRIYLFGSSLGGGIATVFASVEPDVRVGVLSVPFDPVGGILSCGNRYVVGASFATRLPSLLNSPGIKVLDGCSVGPPRFNENFPLRDQIPLTVQLTNGATTVIQSPVSNTVLGAMALQEAGENIKWVGQAGSPLAYAPHLSRAPLAGVPPKSVLVLTAKGDQTAPNPTTTAIVRAGDLAERTLYYRHDLYRSLHSSLPANPHSFASSIPEFGEIALGVQDMVGKFFFSDGTVLTVPEPSQFFEFPILLPLPEGLNYIK